MKIAPAQFIAAVVDSIPPPHDTYSSGVGVAPFPHFVSPPALDSYEKVFTSWGLVPVIVRMTLMVVRLEIEIPVKTFGGETCSMCGLASGVSKQFCGGIYGNIAPLAM